MIRNIQQRVREAQEERAEAARLRAEEARREEEARAKAARLVAEEARDRVRAELRDAWRELSRVTADIRAAIRSGGLAEDFEDLMQEHASVLQRWGKAKSPIPDDEAQAIYAALAEDGEGDAEEIPVDSASLRALAADAVAVFQRAGLFRARTNAREEEIDRGIDLGDMPTSVYETVAKERDFFETVASEAGLLAEELATQFRIGLAQVSAESWRSGDPQSEGAYGVKITSTPTSDGRTSSSLTTLLLSYHGRMLWDDAEELYTRIQHVGSQPLRTGLSLEEAVSVKEDMEMAGYGVKIEEASAPTASSGFRRTAIPEPVRHEVWRRDQGRCVDCGSRERLEFDHIIPLSQGGSNTARNLELRCETCNRRKAASI